MQKVEFPHFVSLAAFGVLPDFLEALVGGLRAHSGVSGMSFDPDKVEYDTEEGKVEFELFGPEPKEKVVFKYRYSPGEEGTRGNVDHLEYILFINKGGISYRFSYLKHACNCPYCPGMKYPFMPSGEKSEYIFRNMTEEERLNAIRAYITPRG